MAFGGCDADHGQDMGDYGLMWFKGQDTTIVNKFLEERYKQLLAEMPSEYVAAIREALCKANAMVCTWATVSEVQIDSYKYHAFNHIAKYARNDMIKFPFAQMWFKGQDTTIVNKFLEERYKQLLAEMPSEYVAAIREALCKANAMVCTWATVSEV
ncbi:hypothetical protein AK812_SmicGene23810 [Symbiodinium microadriaticum]|uniref:Uncharacterized protein n=1 Tax=Symbiodinium microadriaticum TaxID=2951 RepID=A0A1Q9DGB4_SYMMI|nr:hypothetical protein AK812_SmicGene23810 [Symbiodinium microadriaticum]